MFTPVRTFAVLSVLAASSGAAWSQPAPVIVAPETAPVLNVALTPAAEGAWVVAMTPERFTFVDGPGANVVGEGRAAVTIDGGDAVAVLGPDHTIAPLSRGEHTIGVALVARDGAAYTTTLGKTIAERFVIDVQRSAFGEPRLIPLDLVGTAIAAGDVVRVDQGETVALRWTVDQEQELHLHGYDIEVEATPAFPTTMVFVATAAGRFPVERHAATGGEATVLYLEVFP